MNIIKSIFPLRGSLESLQGGRPENQDFLGYADTPLGFLIVLCDGMGGGPGGRTASTSIVDYIVRYINSQDNKADRIQVLKKSVASADLLISQLSVKTPSLVGMGTTVVALLVNKESAIVVHVGDSRMYQFRYGQKVFRTADHSMVGELVRQGTLTEEQARLSSQSNIITRAINGRGLAEPDISELAFEKGDRFLLCTDGIWGAMPEPVLIKKTARGKQINSIISKLAYDVDQIGKNNGGNHDNLTAALIEVGFNSKKKVTMGKKVVQILSVLVICLVVSIVTSIALFSHYSSSIKKSESDIKILTDSVTYLKSEVSASQEALYKGQMQLTNSQEKNISNNKEILKLVDELNSAKKEISKLKEDKNKLQEENDKLSNDNKKLKDEHDKLKKSSSNQNSKVTSSSSSKKTRK